MQMMLLTVAVIVICAAHLKWYKSNTFKLQGGTGRKTNIDNGLQFEDLN